MSTDSETAAERIAVKRGRGHATKQRCKSCDGRNRATRPDPPDVVECGQCEGYGYVYLIGKSGEPRSVPQLLARRPEP